MDNRCDFPYDLAFDRNLGLVTDWEQIALRAKRVAIAGMGGVGGIHLLTLARLGIGGFTISDFDQFEFANFNRQVGANTFTVGRDKSSVLEEMARAINPELQIRRFDAGVTHATVDDFLRNVDLFVDGLDFFALSLRRHVFARCAELGIPAVTAAPIGMGVAFIAFQPTGMSFEQYFRFEGQPEEEQHLRFLLGLTPQAFHRHYLVDPTRIDLARRRGPSTVAACQLCAGVVAVAAIKLLLRRGDLKPAPYNHQFDPYYGRYRVTRLTFGNAGPMQRLKIAVGRRMYTKFHNSPAVPEPSAASRTTIEEILNLARWAPSGDNVQPWRFQVIDNSNLKIHIRHDLENIYEYRTGEPTWLSAGMLIETISIAATAWQRTLAYEEVTSAAPCSISVRLQHDDNLSLDPLLSFLTLRSVDRRAYRWRSLSASEKTKLAACLNGVSVDWQENFKDRWLMARLSAEATKIRLRCPEAFEIHQRIIDWDHAQSPSGIPAHAVGFSGLTRWLMRWSLSQRDRTKWVNQLGGGKALACQMDYIPGLRSSAYFVIRRQATHGNQPATAAELIEIGRSIQRFWLTATQLGLAMQPVLAPLAFAHYGERMIKFSKSPGLCAAAEILAHGFHKTLRASSSEVVFIGRIGEPFLRLPTHRSTRRSLAQMMI